MSFEKYFYEFVFAIDNCFYCNSLKIYYMTKFNMTTYFENLIGHCLVELQVLNTYVKFHANRILFTIKFINLFFMCNFKLQKLI